MQGTSEWDGNDQIFPGDLRVFSMRLAGVLGGLPHGISCAELCKAAVMVANHLEAQHLRLFRVGRRVEVLVLDLVETLNVLRLLLSSSPCSTLGKIAISYACASQRCVTGLSTSVTLACSPSSATMLEMFVQHVLFQRSLSQR